MRQLAARPSRTKSPVVKYVLYAIVLAALGVAGFRFLPSMLSRMQDSANSKPTQTEPAANGAGTGPMGEVNGAMDVSDAMEGGSSSKPRPANARPPVAAQTSTTPAANPAVRSTNDAAHARHRQTDPASVGHH
jgi:hypothetical protein